MCYKALPKTIVGLPSPGKYVAVPFEQIEREAWTQYMGILYTSLMLEQSEIRIRPQYASIFFCWLVILQKISQDASIRSRTKNSQMTMLKQKNLTELIHLPHYFITE